MRHPIPRKELYERLKYPDINGFNDIFDLHIYTPEFVEIHRAMTFSDLHLIYRLAFRAYETVSISVDIEHKSDIYIYCE